MEILSRLSVRAQDMLVSHSLFRCLSEVEGVVKLSV
jgi:hypothetical protein